jgi:hypothetical protein
MAMSVRIIIVLVALVVLTAGCKSQQEKCGEAKVAAHSAWTAYATASDAYSDTAFNACWQAAEALPFDRQLTAKLACGSRAPGSSDIAPVAHAASGHAIAFHEATTRFAESYSSNVGPRPAYDAAIEAANAQWEACQAVDP